MTAIRWILACTAGVAAMLSQASLAQIQSAGEVERFEFDRGLMGTHFRIVIYAPDSSHAADVAEAAFARVESLNQILSDYLPDSELNAVSARSGTDEAILISDDLWRVLAHASRLSGETDGAFDVTVGALTRLWRRAMRRGSLPNPDAVAEKRSSTGFHLMELDSTRRSVRLSAPGMRLDLGGIGKGYAVDEAFHVLEKKGFTQILVDGGGDMRLGRPPPGRSGWAIEVGNIDSTGLRGVEKLLLSNTAVATSGDRYRHVEIEGIRYSHILDPRTGLGLTGSREITVFASTCLEADALASALSVLGSRRAWSLLNRYPGSSARLVEAHNGDYHMTEIP